MAEAQSNQIGMTRADLQTMLEAVVKAAKEPSEVDKIKIEKERALLLKREKEALEVSKAQVAATEARRKNCTHMHTFKGQRFHGWQGQVNSDGFVTPVCKYCGTVWPPFSAAKCLPDAGKQGVNMEESNASVELLTEMHKKSFPGGCPRKSCFICSAQSKSA